MIFYKQPQKSITMKTVTVVLCRQNSVSSVQVLRAENTQQTACKYSYHYNIICLKVSRIYR